MNRTRGRSGILAALALCALGYGSGAAGQGSGVPGGTLPYVPPASGSGGLEGFVWVVNHAATPATVAITGYDDTGEAYGPVDLAMPASSSVRLLSQHLERGSAVDGLPVGLGDGTGDWRLEFRGPPAVGAVVLVRTPDKFMTSLQAVVAPESEGATVYPVVVFNPGSNTSKASFLRLVNPGDAAASVTISGTDAGGAGAPGGDVRLTVPAGGAVRVTALELEVGESHLEGQLGDGAGKWRLRVASDRPLFVMNLLRSQTDSGLVYVSNLSVGAVRAAPPPPPAVPDLVVDSAAVSDSTLEPGQSFTLTARVVNRGDAPSLSAVLRWRLSRDATITESDSSPGSTPVKSLQPSASESLSFRLSAPAAEGIWYYGGCVAAVAGETDRSNNCSAGAQVSVRSTNLCPADHQGFETLTVGKRVVTDNSVIRFRTGGSFEESSSLLGGTYYGSYRYTGTGRNTGRLWYRYDAGLTCDISITCVTRTSGTFRSSCGRTESWRLTP